jgi:hypothetical protein
MRRNTESAVSLGDAIGTFSAACAAAESNRWSNGSSSMAGDHSGSSAVSTMSYRCSGWHSNGKPRRRHFTFLVFTAAAALDESPSTAATNP